MDVIGSLLLLLFLSPVLIAIIVAVCADGGPPFFTHRRIGLRGREFACLKIRTMRVDADEILPKYLQDHPAARAEWRSTRKLRHDPRITAIGSVLRSMSLDELPQLLNVLCGDMSLVGPRPVVWQELVDFYEPLGGAAAYLSMRPGLTGLWQVSRRSNMSYRERVALDKAYAENFSFVGDVIILLRTVAAILRGASY